MISIGAAAARAARLPITDMWHRLPAAVVYQLALYEWTREGHVFRTDNRDQIRAKLCPPIR